MPNADSTDAGTSSTSTPSEPPTNASRWRNPYSALPRVRWVVQGAYLAFLALVGVEFARFVSQALADGEVTAARPPAVEAFLPISALVGLKRFVLTRYWDEIHPAGLTILLAAIATALVARKAFCSWVCPVGTISRALEWVGKKTLWRRGRTKPLVPRRLDVALAGLKYLLLAFFVKIVLVDMSLDTIEEFLRAPFNLAADAAMLRFFTSPSSLVLAVLGALVVLSVVVKNFWCRYLCPYGALLGLASFLSPIRVRRDPETCNDCRACSRACPAEIQVHAKLRVLTPECTGCMSCVSACTVPDCLTVTRKARAGLSPWLVPALAVGTMVGFWAVARATGFWETSVRVEAFRWAYRMFGG